MVFVILPPPSGATQAHPKLAAPFFDGNVLACGEGAEASKLETDISASRAERDIILLRVVLSDKRPPGANGLTSPHFARDDFI